MKPIEYLQLAAEYHLAGEYELERIAYETYLYLKEKAAQRGNAATA
ncbi:hypothetical protein ABEV55_12375 [Aneurinibacillus thermoaerophilus]|nr:hypothetical protein [Aneurinibacillus thermoaerophilus]